MLTPENRELFAESAIGVWFANRRGQIRRAIAKLPGERLSDATLPALGDAVLERYRHSPLSVEIGDRKTTPAREIQIPSREGGVGSPGVAIAVSVPYVGDEMLWRFRPRTRGAKPPLGIVHPVDSEGVGRVEIAVEYPRDATRARVESIFEEQLSGIDAFVDQQRRDVEVENRVLVSFIASSLRERLEDVEP